MRNDKERSETIRNRCGNHVIFYFQLSFPTMNYSSSNLSESSHSRHYYQSQSHASDSQSYLDVDFNSQHYTNPGMDFDDSQSYTGSNMNFIVPNNSQMYPNPTSSNHNNASHASQLQSDSTSSLIRPVTPPPAANVSVPDIVLKHPYVEMLQAKYHKLQAQYDDTHDKLTKANGMASRLLSDKERLLGVLETQAKIPTWANEIRNK